MIPLSMIVKEIPKASARLPAIKLPKGKIPKKVSIYTPITLPINSLGTFVCNMVFISAMAVTLEPPINIKAISDNKYILDNENNTNENEKIKEAKTKSLPLYLKSPKRANNSAAINAPNPAQDINTAKPCTPTFNISLANIGINIT